jgi:hypothetical protein
MYDDPNWLPCGGSGMRAIIGRAAPRVAERLVRDRHRVKALGGRGVVRVDIWVCCAGGAPIGAVEIGRRGATPDA